MVLVLVIEEKRVRFLCLCHFFILITLNRCYWQTSYFRSFTSHSPHCSAPNEVDAARYCHYAVMIMCCPWGAGRFQWWGCLIFFLPLLHEQGLHSFYYSITFKLGKCGEHLQQANISKYPLSIYRWSLVVLRYYTLHFWLLFVPNIMESAFPHIDRNEIRQTYNRAENL